MSADASACGPDAMPLQDRFSRGLDAPICLTWELTYACNLACVHCLSSSGRRDPDELTPAEARGIVDDMVDMKVFYVNIGGGEPMLRPDFFDLVSYAVDRQVGVKFSTNGTRLTAERARQLAALDYLDVQISIDGATAATNDARAGRGLVRRRPHGHGQPGRGRLRALQDQRGRHPGRTCDELDALAAIADSLRRPAAPDPPAPLGPGRRHLGCAAPDGGAAAHALPLARRASRRADR